MLDSVRQFWIGLAAVIVIAVQVNGALSTQHRIEHASDFPAASYLEADLVSHDHDHDDPAHHNVGTALGDGQDGDLDDHPVRHHHHGGGADLQLALSPTEQGVGVLIPKGGGVAPGLDRSPPGVELDDFLDPPRPMRLIA